MPDSLRPHVFLSHSWHDKSAAKDLGNRLTEQGCTAWVDHQNITIGQRIRDLISNTLNKSDAVVVLLTDHAAASTGVKEEVIRAHERNIPIILVRDEKAAISEMSPVFREANAIIGYNNDDGRQIYDTFDDVIKAVKQSFDETKSHMRTRVNRLIHTLASKLNAPTEQQGFKLEMLDSFIGSVQAEFQSIIDGRYTAHIGLGGNYLTRATAWLRRADHAYIVSLENISKFWTTEDVQDMVDAYLGAQPEDTVRLFVFSSAASAASHRPTLLKHCHRYGTSGAVLMCSNAEYDRIADHIVVHAEDVGRAREQDFAILEYEKDPNGPVAIEDILSTRHVQFVEVRGQPYGVIHHGKLKELLGAFRGRDHAIDDGASWAPAPYNIVRLSSACVSSPAEWGKVVAQVFPGADESGAGLQYLDPDDTAAGAQPVRSAIAGDMDDSAVATQPATVPGANVEGGPNGPLRILVSRCWPRANDAAVGEIQQALQETAIIQRYDTLRESVEEFTALNNADCLAVVISQSTLKKPWLLEELVRADERGVVILPILDPTCSWEMVPAFLADARYVELDTGKDNIKDTGVLISELKSFASRDDFWPAKRRNRRLIRTAKEIVRNDDIVFSLPIAANVLEDVLREIAGVSGEYYITDIRWDFNFLRRAEALFSHTEDMYVVSLGSVSGFWNNPDLRDYADQYMKMPKNCIRMFVFENDEEMERYREVLVAHANYYSHGKSGVLVCSLDNYLKFVRVNLSHDEERVVWFCTHDFAALNLSAPLQRPKWFLASLGASKLELYDQSRGDTAPVPLDRELFVSLMRRLAEPAWGEMREHWRIFRVASNSIADETGWRELVHMVFGATGTARSAARDGVGRAITEGG